MNLLTALLLCVGSFQSRARAIMRRSPKPERLWRTAALAAVLVAGCGGGGGGGNPTPTPPPAPKAWQGAALLETDNAGNARDPKIALDASGNAMAVWRQSDGTRNNLWANRYNASTSAWGTATLLETDNAGNASNPQIALDASGNALAVWYQSDGTRNNIWANRYNASTSAWGTATLIETDNAGSASSPQIADRKSVV